MTYYHTQLTKIRLMSILVDDQDKALKFYTAVPGLVKKTEIPMGEHKWLTVVSGKEPDGVELVLEPKVLPLQEAIKKHSWKPEYLWQRSRSMILKKNMKD
jgi:hypothetical protein